MMNSMPSFRKSVRRVTQKQKKVTQYTTLSSTDYLQHYQKVLELCVRNLVESCGMPSIVVEAAKRLWSMQLAKVSLKDVVAPKNSDA